MSITNYNWTSDHPRYVVDLNGDGRADVVGIGPDCVWTSLNDGAGGPGEPTFAVVAFEANAGWRVDGHPRFVADLTGDGRADIIGFGDDGVWVSLGSGDGTFQPAQFVLQELGFNQGWRVDMHPRFVTDLTGDGRADIIGFGYDGVWTALGNGDGSFQPAQFVLQELGFNQGWRVDMHPRFVADLTGDGRADIIGFGYDGVWTALGNGDGTFQPAVMPSGDFSYNTGWRVGDHPRFVVDVSGDGKPDLVGFGDEGVWLAASNGNGTFQPAQFVLADFGRRSNRDTVVRREVIHDHRFRGRIKHLFVLMLENRSYDHMLGFADISGTDAATGQPTTADGLKGTEFNCHAGERRFVQKGAPDVTVAPGHGFLDALEQLCGRYATYPRGGPYPEVNNTGYIWSLTKERVDDVEIYRDRGPEIMQCFDPDHLPILTTLAREFAVCDRWFSSMPGPTEPNRMFLHAATSGEFDTSPSHWDIGLGSTIPWGGYEFEGGTIFDALDEADIKWRIYAGDHFPVVGEFDGISNTFDVKEFEDFAEDLQDPDFDAAFVHLEPDYFGGLLDTGDFTNGDSQHPFGGVAAGERLIKATYEAIRNSPHWRDSMLIVNYDEHGGFYDHVVPGPAEPSGSEGRALGFRFDQLGARVPAVVISPWIPRNTVEHRLLEHCSVIATVMDLFDVPALRHARDLRKICGVSHLANLSQPRTDTPAKLRDVVVSDIPAGETPRAAPDQPISGEDSLVAAAVRVAAIENMTLEPARREEIMTRVANIKTYADAAAFLRDVKAKMAALKLPAQRAPGMSPKLRT